MVVAGLPYAVLPPNLVRGIMMQVKIMLNGFIVKNGVSERYSPAEIVEEKRGKILERIAYGLVNMHKHTSVSYTHLTLPTICSV